MKAPKEKLTDDEIEERLQRLHGWSRREHYIEKKFVFETFIHSLHFLIHRGSSAARDLNHYPEYVIHEMEVTVRCWTREVKGLTELDFVIAEKIDALTVA